MDLSAWQQAVPPGPVVLVPWLLLAQAAMGGLDTLVNHELRARLPARLDARGELRLHAMRSACYALLFAAVAIGRFDGAWALLPLALALLELAITARDTVIEYRVRHIDALERLVHLALLLNAGAYTLLIALAALHEWGRPSAAHWQQPSVPGALLLACAAGALASGIRDALAAVGLQAQARAAGGRGRPRTA